MPQIFHLQIFMYCGAFPERKDKIFNKLALVWHIKSIPFWECGKIVTDNLQEVHL